MARTLKVHLMTTGNKVLCGYPINNKGGVSTLGESQVTCVRCKKALAALRAGKLSQERERLERIMPGGVPRWVRCYDNGGESADRYTVVYTGNYPGRDRLCRYVSMSGAPYYPQGVCQHGESYKIIDRPTYRHLGKHITFDDLPNDCKQVVVSDYRHYWELCEICGRSAKWFEALYTFRCDEHKPKLDQYGQTVPEDLIVLDAIDIVDEWIVYIIERVDWYEAEGHPGLLLVSAYSVRNLGLETDPLDVGINLYTAKLQRVATPLKRWSVQDGFYHA
jgi:hypothetical protein